MWTPGLALWGGRRCPSHRQHRGRSPETTGENVGKRCGNPLKTHRKPMGFLELHGVFGFWNMIPTFVIMNGGFSTFKTQLHGSKKHNPIPRPSQKPFVKTWMDLPVPTRIARGQVTISHSHKTTEYSNTAHHRLSINPLTTHIPSGYLT